MAHLVAASSAFVAGAPACSNAVGPVLPTISLTAYIADHEYFDNEPVYVVFQLTNTGNDTAWVMPFNLAGQSLQAVLVRSDGATLQGWGIIADYITAPGWRGVPIAPQRGVYEVGLLQDYWGQYDPTVENLYYSHHVLAGKYQLEATFAWDPRHQRPPIGASAVPLLVRSRTPAEDSMLAQVDRLVAMPWDSAERQMFLDSLVSYLERRVVADSADPYLPMLAVRQVITAAAVGYSPDSVMIERLVVLYTEIAKADRDMPAGALAVLGFSYYRPELLPGLASELDSSLAGNVAHALALAHP